MQNEDNQYAPAIEWKVLDSVEKERVRRADRGMGPLMGTELGAVQRQARKSIMEGNLDALLQEYQAHLAQTQKIAGKQGGFSR